MPKKTKAPTRQSVNKVLGSAIDIWDEITKRLNAQFGQLTQEWKPSKSDFGWMCLLKQKQRTVVYLTPENNQVRVAMVLGDRAAKQALASDLPQAIKELIAEARPYAEGRGIRFVVANTSEIPVVFRLLSMKMAK